MNLLLITIIYTTNVVWICFPVGCVLATDLQVGQDSCTLSFVVPKEKFKTSCNPEQRITRKLNTVETKLVLYQQRVQDLQEQMIKERKNYVEQINKIRQTQTDQKDYAILNLRVQALENKVNDPGKLKRTKSLSFNPIFQSSSTVNETLLSNLDKNQTTNLNNPAINKALSNLEMKVIKSEIKRLFDNYTRYLNRVVRELVLARIFVPQASSGNDYHIDYYDLLNKTKKMNFDKITPQSKKKSTFTNQINETSTPKVLTKLITNISKIFSEASPAHLNNYTTHVSIDESSISPITVITDQLINNVTFTTHRNVSEIYKNMFEDITLNFTMQTSNGTIDYLSKYRQNYVSSEHGDYDNFTNVINKTTGQKQTISTDLIEETTPASKSRMSNYNVIKHKFEDSKSPLQTNFNEEKQINTSQLLPEHEKDKENIIKYTQDWIEQMLYRNFNDIFNHQTKYMMKLVTELSYQIDRKISLNRHTFQTAEKRLIDDLQRTEKAVNQLGQEVDVLSQNVHNMFEKTENLDNLHATVLKLKVNATTQNDVRRLTVSLDEQKKKMHKVERLTDVYYRSLEHYRNKTKSEHREVQTNLSNTVAFLTVRQANNFRNISYQLRQFNYRLNATTEVCKQTTRRPMQIIEDNNLLMQIDLSILENKLQSSLSKNEQHTKHLTENVNNLRQKTRNIQKTLNSVIVTQKQVSNTTQNISVQLIQLQTDMKLDVSEEWVPYKFNYRRTYIDCIGDQYVHKSGYKSGRLVGVVLCSNSRYKIFLAQTLADTFLNIGDKSGMGEDHCQFVKARNLSLVKVSPFKRPRKTELGYVRAHWNEEPRIELLNVIRPSPAWYECGVTIP